MGKQKCIGEAVPQVLSDSWPKHLCDLLNQSRKMGTNAHQYQFSHSVVSDSLLPHGLQHTRLPCPSLSTRVCSNSCLLSQWCYPTISSSVTLFSSRLQPFPASVSFPIRQPNYWSFSVSISPSNEYSLLISFTLYWFDHFSVQGTLKSLLQHHSLKASVLQCSAFLMVQFSYLHMTTRKIIAFIVWTFFDNVLSAF